ncbi:orotidine-5'-phosphate decarboxylase [Telmatobacter bradus]|uniref:orotidine-5'-phosphate decarboxylase n=1 Tax=Telmatobacter bradus TaxID=474953 RepID=UPI003B431CB8
MPIPDRLNPMFAAMMTAPAPATYDPLEEARRRLIVALDVPTAKAAIDLVNQLETHCHWFKVGLELFVAAGPSVIEPIVARGHSVFLDLKLHDIPNTVAGAVRSAAQMGASLLTLHGAGGPAMLSAAKQALEGIDNPPQLLAVTVLTSMDQSQLKAIGVNRTPAEQVELLAKMGIQAGLNGFVCSPEEVARLRKLTGPEGVLVIPGIRPAGAAVGDQKRIATPAQALRLGASHLVVGRPITQAADPVEAAEAILKEMAEELTPTE